MENLDTREWLLTNGLGSFASGTVCDARTRIYHGWLIAALDPPSQRTLLLSHLDASLQVGGREWALGTNFWTGGTITPLGYQLLRSFEIDPVPTWGWSQESWQLRRRMVMPYGLIPISEPVEAGFPDPEPGNFEIPSLTSNSRLLYKTQNAVLIQYCYEGNESAVLTLRPFIADRNFHHQQSAESPQLQFSQLVGKQHFCLQAIRPSWTGTPWHLRWTVGDYQPDGFWYWNYYYPEEHRRGLGDREDLYSPGCLRATLQPGDTVTLEARVGWLDPDQPNLSCEDFEQVVQAEQQRLLNNFGLPIFDFGLNSADQQPEIVESSKQFYNPKSIDAPAASRRVIQNPKSLLPQLMRAGDQFITYRVSIDGPTVIAGYHWFNDWGRDTLIALPGLALATGRFSVAKGLLETFGRYCQDGLIPNTFPDAGTEPAYNSIDAALWWIEMLGLYLEATQDWDFLVEQYPVVQQIYKGFSAGTLYRIRIDANDGLVTWNTPGVALTWMDAIIDGEPVTPRQGKPIEINALWYSALCWMAQWAEQLIKEPAAKLERLTNQRDRYTQQAEAVKASLQKFWNPAVGYFYDTIELDDLPDPKIRPNGVLALSLYHCAFPSSQARSALQVARNRLLTPYGLRSLDSADVNYVGHYAGNPQHRDSCYHQGTVWSWLIGPFVRAWERFYPQQDTEGYEPVPVDWEPLLNHFQQQACLGSISEIFDGDPPHSPQGAIAQAWSVAELIRHFSNYKY